jgi:hypothetical protein
MRNDITTATTANLLNTYLPSVSAALITQQTFSYQLLTGSYANYPNMTWTIMVNGVANEVGVPPFFINNPNTGVGMSTLIGNPALIGYKIQLNPSSTGFTNIFAANTYITAIDVLSVNQTDKFVGWITLSKSNTVQMPPSTVNYPIQLIATNLTLSTTTFSNPFNINYDTYINMSLQNLPIVTSNNNQLPCTYKIPLNSQGNIVYLNAESNSFEQSVVVSNSSFVLDKITVVFTDRRGNAIQPNYGNYSFSLGFEFDTASGGTTNGNSGVPGTPSTAVVTAPPVIHYFQEFM